MFIKKIRRKFEQLLKYNKIQILNEKFVKFYEECIDRVIFIEFKS